MTALTRTRTTAVKLNEEGKAASGFEKIEISLAEAKLVICVGYFAGRSGMQPGWRAEATIGRDAAFSSLPPAIEGFTARSAAARAREHAICDVLENLLNRLVDVGDVTRGHQRKWLAACKEPSVIMPRHSRSKPRRSELP